MYLLAQIWFFLLLAFLSGLALGYVLWRSCGRSHLVAGHQAQLQDLKRRLAAAELERNRFSAAALEAEGEILKLRAAAEAPSAARTKVPEQTVARGLTP